MQEIEFYPFPKNSNIGEIRVSINLSEKEFHKLNEMESNEREKYIKSNGTVQITDFSTDYEVPEISDMNISKIKEVDNKVKMRFIDAPIGARFRYPGMNEIWVKINSYPKSRFEEGRGLIAKWEGNKQHHQQFCSFTDEEGNITFDTIVELV